MATCEEIIAEFREKTERFADLAKAIETILVGLTKGKNLPIHVISSRVKEEESLRKKIIDSPGKYNNFEDITDYCGIRVITYFEETVKQVSEAIEAEFNVDQNRSMDKKELLAPEAFGYRSVHFIVKLNETRGQLPENQSLTELSAEIQVRSVLQHAWAEIEHDLKYKSQCGTPFSVRRQLTQLASLLELADSQFNLVKDTSDEHIRAVQGQESGNNCSESYEIDFNVLEYYIETNEILGKIDDLFVIETNTQLEHRILNHWAISDLVRSLRYLNIKTVRDLNTALSAKQNKIPAFAKAFTSYRQGEPLPHGISLLFLEYVRVSEFCNQEQVKDFLDFAKIGCSLDRDEIAQRILNAGQNAV